jgi:hypothetical protein
MLEGTNGLWKKERLQRIYGMSKWGPNKRKDELSKWIKEGTGVSYLHVYFLLLMFFLFET